MPFPCSGAVYVAGVYSIWKAAGLARRRIKRPGPARFAVLRESPLWAAVRADSGARWGALADDATSPSEVRLRAARACRLLGENDGFRVGRLAAA
jgi:hypothetical protein